MAEVGLAMNTLNARLATFQEEHHVAKRRASSQKRKGNNIASWPHATPSPDDLARAGFFYKPGSESNDNVQCFKCTVKLDGWETGDVALSEHLAHSGACPWALSLSVASGDEDRDPMGDELVEARKGTYGDQWPHEGKKGWKCKTQKMVEAGWCYDPAPEMEDGVTCFYCSLSLDGWEPKDNPMDEHRRRSPDCAFFVLTEHYAATKPNAKSNGRASRGSKASRLSTQSMQSTFSEAPSLASLGDAGLDMDVDDTTATVASTVSTTAKGQKKATRTASGNKGKKRGAKQASEEPSVLDAPADEDLEEEQLVKEEPVLAVEEPKKRAPRAKAKAKAKSGKTQAHAQDESQLLSELMDAVPEVVESEKTGSRRGVKRTSDGMAKVEEPPVTSADDAPAPKSKKGGKQAKGKKGKAATNDSQEGSTLEPIDAVMEEQAAPEPPVAKSKRAVKTKKQAAPPIADSKSPEVSDDNIVILGTTPEPEEFEPSPTPKRKPSAAPQPSARKPTPEATVESQHSTPHSTRSQHSSNAENHRPSSTRAPPTAVKDAAATKPTAPSETRIAAPHTQHAFTSPTKTTRVPLAASTPNRSPTRRSPQKLGQLTSSIPWTAVDLDAAFLASPAKGAQENASTGGSVAQKLHDVGGALTSPEKEMSVEEWIRWRAARGEAVLKAECERMVSLFEREGTRGLGVLGGIRTG